MNSKPLNRPFVSYVLTQSMLVLIVMAASYLITDLLRDAASISLNRFWVSMSLVLLAQMPVAILYARFETRKLTAVEGWALSIVFVGMTLAFEMVLQSLAGQTLVHLLPSDVLKTESVFRYAPVFIGGFIVGVLLAACLVNLLFRYAVRNNLGASEGGVKGGLLDVVPGVNPARSRLFRPAAKRDYAELYRRELIGANVAIFGLSLMVFGPAFMHLLKLSLPLSMVFSIVCVANRMARVERSAQLSERCLNVAMQMLPMTVASVILLALSTLYANFVNQHGGDIGVVAYFTWLFAGHGFGLSDQTQVAAYIGVLFAICLAGNTLLLVLFAKLIRPLVTKGMRVARAKRRSLNARIEQAAAPAGPLRLTTGKELKAVSARCRGQTPRPRRIASD